MSIFKLIKEDFLVIYDKDPAIKSPFEVLFNYPGFWAIFWYRLAHYLHKKHLRLLARTLMGLSQILTNIDIHPAAKIGRRVVIDHGIGIVVGETAIIGNDVLIYQGVTLGGVSLVQGKRHPTLHDGVVVGAGAKVLGNITIGENSKIGANSVVIKDVPANSTAVGIPARIVTKGRDKNPLSHNKLPDINKELFEYLIKRVKVLEEAILSDDKSCIETKDKELEKIYDMFLKSMD